MLSYYSSFIHSIIQSFISSLEEITINIIMQYNVENVEINIIHELACNINNIYSQH